MIEESGFEIGEKRARRAGSACVEEKLLFLLFSEIRIARPAPDYFVKRLPVEE